MSKAPLAILASGLAALGLWLSLGKPSTPAELPTAPQANKPTSSAPLPSEPTASSRVALAETRTEAQAGEPAASAPAPRPKTDLDYKRGWLESALKELNAPANAGFIEPQLERALTTAIAIELDRKGRGEPMVSDGSTQDYSQPGTQFFTMNARVYSFRPGEYPAYDQLAKFRELRGAWAQKAAKYPLNSPEGNPANEPQLPADLIESVKELARQTLAQTAR